GGRRVLRVGLGVQGGEFAFGLGYLCFGLALLVRRLGHFAGLSVVAGRSGRRRTRSGYAGFGVERALRQSGRGRATAATVLQHLARRGQSAGQLLELAQQRLGAAEQQDQALEHLDAFADLRDLLAGAALARLVEARGERITEGAGRLAGP